MEIISIKNHSTSEYVGAFSHRRWACSVLIIIKSVILIYYELNLLFACCYLKAAVHISVALTMHNPWRLISTVFLAIQVMHQECWSLFRENERCVVCFFIIIQLTNQLFSLVFKAKTCNIFFDIRKQTFCIY